MSRCDKVQAASGCTGVKSKQGTHHAVLQESSMEGLQDSFMSSKAPAMSTNACESTANFALQSSEAQIWPYAIARKGQEDTISAKKVIAGT